MYIVYSKIYNTFFNYYIFYYLHIIKIIYNKNSTCVNIIFFKYIKIKINENLRLQMFVYFSVFTWKIFWQTVGLSMFVSVPTWFLLLQFLVFQFIIIKFICSKAQFSSRSIFLSPNIYHYATPFNKNKKTEIIKRFFLLKALKLKEITNIHR